MRSTADSARAAGTALTVTVAQPVMVTADLAAAVAGHAAMIREAGSRLVVFPELSLTGYDLSSEPVDLTDPALTGLIASCRETDSVALVGAPIRERGQDFIATVMVDAQGATVVYRKCWLGADERGRFSAGAGPAVVDVDGWRIGLAICKDTGVDAHTDALASSCIDLYAAGVVHHAHELDEQRRRVDRISARTHAYVALASCAGATGEGYHETAGHSVIWDPDGATIIEAGADADTAVTAVLRRRTPRSATG